MKYLFAILASYLLIGSVHAMPIEQADKILQPRVNEIVEDINDEITCDLTGFNIEFIAKKQVIDGSRRFATFDKDSEGIKIKVDMLLYTNIKHLKATIIHELGHVHHYNCEDKKDYKLGGTEYGVGQGEFKYNKYENYAEARTIHRLFPSLSTERNEQYFEGNAIENRTLRTLRSTTDKINFIP